MAELVVEPGLAARLQRDAAEMGIAIDRLRADQLALFVALLLRWNKSFNIISRKDEERVVPRHILDSLGVAPWLRGPDVLDLGTGGGLPGIPLAILRTDLNFTLLDRSQRKIRFLGQVKRDLGLANVRPLCVDIADLDPGLRFDCIVSRAVKDLEGLWALAAGRLRSGRSGAGVLLAMASTRGEPAAERPAGPDLPGGRIVARPVIRIPGLAQAHRLDVVERQMHAETGN